VITALVPTCADDRICDRARLAARTKMEIVVDPETAA
jgi:hypothetical protein